MESSPHPSIRNTIKIDMEVSIAINDNDVESQWKRGLVKYIETPQNTPYEENGIEVRIDDGTIGRIKKTHQNNHLTFAQILDMLRRGESKELEFKQTFKTDTKSNQTLKCLRDSVVKSICAFMNTDGGHLFIGIDDSGSIIGLDPDYENLNIKRDNQTKQDKLIQEISDYVRHRLKDDTLSTNYNIQIQNIKGQDICIIQVKHANKKVFMEQEIFYKKCGGDNLVCGHRDVFYCRDTVSSKELDIRNVDEYYAAKNTGL